MRNKSNEKGNNIIYFNKNEHRTFNKKRIAGLIILLVIIVIFIVGYILYATNEEFRTFMDMNVLRKEITENNLNSIVLEDYDKSNIYAYSNKIAVLKDNKLSLYTASGRQEGQLEVQISTPITYSNGRYFMIAQQDSSKAYLIRDNEIVWEKDLEGNISRVSVNSAGYSSIILTGTAYKTVIVVFDNQGNELFKYMSSTITVDSAISEDNQYLSFAEVNISGTFVQSNIKTLSIEKAKTSPNEANVFTYNADSNSLILNIKYQNNNKLVCMYDDSVHVIKNNEDTKVADINSSGMTFYSIELNNHLVGTVESTFGLLDTQTSVQIINMDNQNQSTYNFNGVTKELYSYGNKIALNLGSEVHFIETNGWLIKKYTSSQEIRKIVITEEIAGIVYRDKIEIVNL